MSLRPIRGLLPLVSIAAAAVLALLMLAPLPAIAANPLKARPLYVDPDSLAVRAVRDDPGSAPALRRIASAPQARWFGDWVPTSKIRAQVDRYVGAASRARRLPVLTVYAVPHRDCGRYSAGGLHTPAQYASWITQVRRGIARRPAIVVLEPDALAGADCLSPAARRERYAMLRAAATALAADPRTVVYLDGGHSRWLSAASLAGRLRAAGLGRGSRVRGFSLDVGNFFTTSEEVRYGERVARLVGGRHYVVDTSRNGRGPAPNGPEDWCNPAGRGLGARPTTHTSGAHADAYLWIKRPGESDGDCGRGEPAAGAWFTGYALGLVARAQP